MKVHAIGSGLLALSCAAGVASGLPVVYSEAVGGDLPQSGAPLPTFAFDVGVNTVSGQFGSVAPFDLDAFAFTIPAGAQLVAGQVAVVDVVGDITSSTWGLRAGTANSFFSGSPALEHLSASSPGTDTLASVPLGPNVYSLSHESFGFFPDSRAAYTFTFQVVPEPASLALPGLAGLAMLRRRPRRRGPKVATNV